MLEGIGVRELLVYVCRTNRIQITYRVNLLSATQNIR